MPFTGLMPSMEAIQQAVREPLSQAPREHKAFAVYIFERARQIDRERALARNPAEGREDFPPQSTIVATQRARRLWLIGATPHPAASVQISSRARARS